MKLSDKFHVTTSRDLEETWLGFWCWIWIKLSEKLLKYDPYHMTPPPGSSGTSMSSKTPGRDLEDRWSLDRVCDVRSWWNFHRSFWSMFLSYDTNSRFIRNLHVLQDSRKRLRGQVESWQGFWCWILMKLSQKLLKDDPYHLTPSPSSSGISISSMTQGRYFEGRWCLYRVSIVGSWWNFHRSFWSMIPIIWLHLQVHQEPPFPLILQEETWWTDGVLMGFWCWI